MKRVDRYTMRRPSRHRTRASYSSQSEVAAASLGLRIRIAAQRKKVAGPPDASIAVRLAFASQKRPRNCGGPALLSFER